MALPVTIRTATWDDLYTVAELFDGYRQFYGQPPDYALAEHFLRERFFSKDSVIFLAFDETNKAVGFAQLSPSFSSVAARRTWLLNDLFVAPAARRKGVGQALLDAARAHGKENASRRILLYTAGTNKESRALYEKNGYKLEDVFVMYKLEL